MKGSLSSLSLLVALSLTGCGKSAGPAVPSSVWIDVDGKVVGPLVILSTASLEVTDRGGRWAYGYVDPSGFVWELHPLTGGLDPVFGPRGVRMEYYAEARCEGAKSLSVAPMLVMAREKGFFAIPKSAAPARQSTPGSRLYVHEGSCYSDPKPVPVLYPETSLVPVAKPSPLAGPLHIEVR